MYFRRIKTIAEKFDGMNLSYVLVLSNIVSFLLFGAAAYLHFVGISEEALLTLTVAILSTVFGLIIKVFMSVRP